MAEFFAANITYIFFVYGLAFFTMGIAVALELGRTTQLRIRPCLPWLAAFGLIHGVHEWAEMLQILHNVHDTPQIEIGRLITLGVSFALLIIFGASLLHTLERPILQPATATMILVSLCVAGIATLYSPQLPTTEWLHASDTWVRYSLGISGAVLSGWALTLQGRQFIRQGSAEFGRDLIIAGIALALYGLVGQLFAGRSILPLTNIFNTETFLQLFGFPIQLFRATMASIVAIFMIRALRIFEVESQLRLAQAQQQALEIERRRSKETDELNQQLQEREALRGELLRKIVRAQEEERTRVARELHDETAQAFSALALGLSGIEETLEANPTLARELSAHLQTLSMQALDDLRRFVADLRPPQLDELGLVPALHWLVDELHARQPDIQVNFQITGTRRRLNTEIETTLFRITQETLSNVVRHAKASQVEIYLAFEPDEIHLNVKDNGTGFDLEQVINTRKQLQAGQAKWGLLGIEERVALANGQFKITSEPGLGTQLDVRIPVLNQGVSYEQDQAVIG